ncbi:MAG: methyltransferase, FxLD system, partial [Pseudonocardiaceae bacterium]
MVTPTTTARDRDYADLRAEMVDYLVQTTGDARTPAVIAALSKVPRHLVIDEDDDVDPAETYAPEDALITKKDPDGSAISSISAARIQAMQLEQAHLRRGQRILEVGSGGVNAAYLAEVVGPEGLVVTVDIDPEVTARARRFLAKTGHDDVVVITGDGATGVPDYAPFDRIVVTVEATDIAPGWWDQLADDGRIVAPMRMGGMTRTLSLARDVADPDRLHAEDLQLCGFVPMQGPGTNPQDLIVLSQDADARVALRLDGGTTEGFDADGLSSSLRNGRVETWTGVEIAGNESFEHLDLWLATSLAPILTLAPTRGAIDAGLVAPVLPYNAPTLVEGTSFTYRTARVVDNETRMCEIGVVAHGPDAEGVATRYAEQIA